MKPNTDTVLNAFDEGWQAYIVEKTLADNPHSRGANPNDWDDWAQGFRAHESQFVQRLNDLGFTE
jgi:hypothetical protein